MKDINVLINGGINVNGSLELFSNIETYEENLNNFLNSIKERIISLNEYKEKKCEILDLCTGSGAIAISLAKYINESNIFKIYRLFSTNCIVVGSK